MADSISREFDQSKLSPDAQKFLNALIRKEQVWSDGEHIYFGLSLDEDGLNRFVAAWKSTMHETK